jgi:alpha-glucosidase
MLVDDYPGDRMMVGEVFLLSTEAVATYYGHDDELHLAFNFPPLFAPWLADRWGTCIEDTLTALGPRGAWPTWVLSNHDNPRHRTRYDRAAARTGEDAATAARRSEARARAAAVLLLTLRGTPFVYQGDELGLADADIPDDRQVDPGGRDGCRAPVPWDAGPDHGWPTRPGASTWLPMAPEADVRNRASEASDPSSILHLYRRAIAVRRATPALTRGTFTFLDAPAGVLAYRREADGDAVDVLVNFTGEAVDLADPSAVGPNVVLASDDPAPSGGFTGVLGPDQAVVIRR